MDIEYSPSARLTDHWVRINGLELHFSRSNGPVPAHPKALVFLHSRSAGDIFSPMVERLSPHHRVYVPKLAGIGDSERPESPTTLAGLVQTLVAWMDHCNLEDAHFAAQSIGCNIAVEMAVRHPQRVASVTLQALTLEPGRRGLLRMLPQWVLAELREVPKDEANMIAQRNVSTQGLRPLVEAMLQHALDERLARMQCPTLLLYGSHDSLESREWVQRAASLLVDGRLQKIACAVAHPTNALHPKAYSDAFLAFVASLSPAKCEEEIVESTPDHQYEVEFEQ